ncbi:hypothetical protein [Idiomarina xiamenensis]|uniref:Alpha/beta hydrolase n=1 Tax=Idiomarina xiamenensis 10-D-4 TaxID=740709 RepID=K2KJI6_9GAMM|nr:hypothetical protein [Idiomarina xiamenensis]EKE86877.1 alpha/beta hydrolase [Idiomarina xiamenensis 10-D-4]
MSEDWITVRAGQQALQQIRQQGLQESDIELLLGASGGPKWFVLQGLDRYLFGEFFAARQRPLNTLGTSAGAWRFASLGQADAVAASDLFCQLYRRQRYSARPDANEITGEALKLLDSYVPDNIIPEILAQNRVHHHMIVARCRGRLTASDGRRQALGLLGSAAANSVNRRWLGRFFERIVFHHPQANTQFAKIWRDLPTQHVPLSVDNFKPSLLATGSIPLILHGVRDIPGAPIGTYRDGGITDYHFDLDFSAVDGLVLYPHFNQQVIPGWFDKRLPWRRTQGKRWPNVVLVTPTEAFLRRLPYGKIPDRTDFAKLDADTRFAYWQQAVDAGRWMADQFHDWLSSGRIKQKVQPW